MKTFNPFKSSINNLTAEELSCLKSVNEGWYVEYKQEIPNAQSIAKSVSAMANSYGGWIFYGIKEESKENSVAGEFLGIDASKVDAALQSIRQSVSNLMTPSCHYEVSAIFGPCESISLAESKAIICVVVPQSVEAPHIHSKGYIYRRISDGSEPVPETDRFLIEKMFQRSSEVIKSYKKWLKKDPEFSKAEANIPYVRIMITPNLWNMPRPRAEVDVDIVKKILNKKDGRRNHIPFDTVYSSSNAIIASQCGENQPIQETLTWKIYDDLASDILIPLSYIDGSLDHIRASLHKFELGDIFTSLLEDQNISNAKVVNLNYIFIALYGLIEAQRELQQHAGWSLDFYIKVKLLNVWRTIPFFDVDYYIKNIRENGLPVCLTSKSISPPGHHPETFRYINHNHDELSEELSTTLQTMNGFVPIAEAFGLPFSHLIKRDYGNDDDNGVPEYFFVKLINAGVRASK